MIISGLDKDIEFTLHEGDYTIQQCFDLINRSQSDSSKSTILREIACKPPQSIKSIFVPFFQPTYLNNISEGLIRTFDDFRKLMVVVICENVLLFHPDTNYFYDIPIHPEHLRDFELERIDTMFEDNNEQFYKKLQKPVVPCAKLSLEGIEYL